MALSREESYALSSGFERDRMMIPDCTKPTPYSNGENAHWWSVETANYDEHGPTSLGECQNCGATFDFSNVVDYDPKTMNLGVKADTQEAPASRRAR